MADGNTPNVQIFENFCPLGQRVIQWEFRRSEIASNDRARFLGFFDVERIRKAGQLKELFSSIQFRIAGYDHDDRQYWEVPEIRKFFRHLADDWPYFHFADTLETPFVCELIKCLIPHVSAVRHADCIGRTVIFDARELWQSHLKLCNGMAVLWEWDGSMSNKQLEDRANSIARSIGDLMGFQSGSADNFNP